MFFLSLRVQFELINHTISQMSLYSPKGTGQRPSCDSPLWLMNRNGAPFVRSELHTLDPQPWEADLTHIKHSQLSRQGLIEQITNVQAYS